MDQVVLDNTDITKKALALHKKGYNGAQSVLNAFIEEMGLDSDQALKLGAGLGSGIGTMQSTCGVLCAALMVLGFRCFDPDAPIASRQLQYEEGRKMLQHFQKTFGSVNCRTLLGVNLSKPGGLKKAREEKVFQTCCPNYIREVCRYLENLPDADDSRR